MLEMWKPPGWTPRRRARCPGTSQPGAQESVASLPPSSNTPARPAARADTSGARRSRGGKARAHPARQAARSAPYRTPGPRQVVQQAERPRRYSPRCSALAPPWPASRELLAAGASSGLLCRGPAPHPQR